MLSLVFRDTETKTSRRYRVPEREARIGREVGDDEIRLPFESISREHARVIRAERGVRLEDLGSKNGIRRGGIRVASLLLQPGETVQLGTAFLTIEESETGDLERDDATLPLEAAAHAKAARGIDAIVHRSAEMQRVVELALVFARVSAPLLLLGETGTGKDTLAWLIHQNGPNARGPFRAENCAAMTEELFASEVFGIEAGVATGVGARAGLFAAAEGGTLFLDEIGDVSAKMQAALLLALERQEIRPAGAARTRPVRTRVILATNRSENVRDDLRFRCKTIEIPPLRERPADVAPLAQHFLNGAAKSFGLPRVAMSRRATELLAAQPWPGNARELKNVVEAALLLYGKGGMLHAEHIRAVLGRTACEPAHSLKERQAARTRDDVVRALRDCGGNKSAAAREVGMSRNGLLKAIRRFGLEE